MSSTDNFFGEVEARRNPGADTCEWRHPAGRHRVLRVGSWNNNDRGYLLSSYRDASAEMNSTDDRGFRVVLEK
jgi:hypothetical protein